MAKHSSLTGDEAFAILNGQGGGGGGGVTPAQLQEEVNARIEGDLELDDEKADVIENTASGSIASFNDGTGKNADELIVNIEPVQSGSGDPSPSNVRPISGWTGANVVVAPLNPKMTNRTLNNGIITFTDDTIIINGQASGTTKLFYNNNDYIPEGKLVISCQDRRLTFGVGTDTSTYANPLVYDSDGTVIFDEVRTDVPFKNYPNETFYIKITACSEITPISWQTEAGTVYGGTLDVTTGVLTVDRAIKTIDGVTNKCTVCSGGATVATPSINISGLGSGKPLASSLKPLTTLAGVRSASNSIYNAIPDSLSRLLLNCDGMIGYGGTSTYATETELLNAVNTWLSTNNVTVVYPLATPITYQLTPTEVATLVGTNNIFADTGDVSVTYKADTKGYVDGKIAEIKQINSDMIAPTEDGATASQAYAQGKYFLRNNQFCKAKTAIASGATFTLGTNYEVTTIAAELFTALNS
jgi:hypothetical protein